VSVRTLSRSNGQAITRSGSPSTFCLWRSAVASTPPFGEHHQGTFGGIADAVAQYRVTDGFGGAAEASPHQPQVAAGPVDVGGDGGLVVGP
jgi:hypothetical protein